MKHILAMFAVCLLLMAVGCQRTSNSSASPAAPGDTNMKSEMRAAVKSSIDELASYSIVSAKHTTKSMEPAPTRRAPETPAPFDAGRFKIVFAKGEQRRVVICQTEEIVGHIAKVVPGVTKVGGYLQILDDPEADHGPGVKLNLAELDYFIQGLYRRFSEPLTDASAALLNETKDYALSVLFSGRTGLDVFHAEQIKKLGFK